jgi:hypothetical protein
MGRVMGRGGRGRKRGTRKCECFVQCLPHNRCVDYGDFLECVESVVAHWCIGAVALGFGALRVKEGTIEVRYGFGWFTARRTIHRDMARIPLRPRNDTVGVKGLRSGACLYQICAQEGEGSILHCALV